MKIVSIVADLIVDVSGHMPGTIKDWPSNIQDGIYAAAERKAIELSAKYGKPLQFDIVGSMCDYDLDHGHYIGVTMRAWLETE